MWKRQHIPSEIPEISLSQTHKYNKVIKYKPIVKRIFMFNRRMRVCSREEV